MLTAEQAGLPEIDYLAESQPDPTPISDLVEATLRTVPDVGETPAAQLAPEELGRPPATAANKSRPAKLVGLVAALATGASLVSACGVGSGYIETVDCTKVKKLDDHKVPINPDDKPADVAVKTNSGTEVIGSFVKKGNVYKYKLPDDPESADYETLPKGKTTMGDTKKITVIGRAGGRRPVVVCPQ